MSLAAGAPLAPSPPGTIYVLGARGGFAAPPRDDFFLLFGRNEADVHVCVGAGDPYVSRFQGRLSCHGREWWLRNEGRLPIRMPGSTFLLSGNECALPDGYSPLFIRSSPRREHLVEIRVVGGRPAAEPGYEAGRRTMAPRTWELSAEERLALTAVAQRYLRQDEYPQPLAWKQVATELNALAGGPEWNAHRVENVVGVVRDRLSRAGVRGLTRAEVGEPVGNTLKDNLIRELLETTTLVPPDLRLLGDPDDLP